MGGVWQRVAVHGETAEEARIRYQEAVERHTEIDARPLKTVDGEKSRK
jgi:hypothetical protein